MVSLFLIPRTINLRTGHVYCYIHVYTHMRNASYNPRAAHVSKVFSRQKDLFLQTYRFIVVIVVVVVVVFLCRQRRAYLGPHFSVYTSQVLSRYGNQNNIKWARSYDLSKKSGLTNPALCL